MSDVKISDNLVVHVPIGILSTIALEEGGCVSLIDLASKWSIIAEAFNFLRVESFETREECALRVGEIYVDKNQKILYVLKDGVPRKNIKVDVKARFR